MSLSFLNLFVFFCGWFESLFLFILELSLHSTGQLAADSGTSSRLNRSGSDLFDCDGCSGLQFTSAEEEHGDKIKVSGKESLLLGSSGIREEFSSLVASM